MKCGTSNKRFALTLGAVALGVSSFAITIRHDVADADYINFGASFTGVGQVLGNVGAGTGTLIANNWVITANHVTRNNPNLRFVVGGTTYFAQTVFERGGYDPNDLANGNDLALIKLTTSVVGAATYGLYTMSDELGQVGITVGAGRTGTGLTGDVTNSSTMRAGTNMIDLFWDARARALVNDFDSGSAPDNFTGSATQTALEHGVAPGDSGGALFIQKNGQYLLAGVTGFRWSADGINNSDYGDGGGYSRISAADNIAWIQQTAGVPEPGTMTLLGLGVAAFVAKRRKKA